MTKPLEQITFILSFEKETPGRLPRVGRVPRITRLMALAIRFNGLLDDGIAKDYSDLAKLGRVTKARITQIMNLLNLAPEIQETLLFLAPVRTWRDPVSERSLRTIVAEASWKHQRKLFAEVQAAGKATTLHDEQSRKDHA
jgi:hypothetical protein